MTQFQLARDWHFQLTDKTSSTLFITLFCTNYRINTVKSINPIFAVREIQMDREGADIIVIGYEVGIKRGVLDHLAMLQVAKPEPWFWLVWISLGLF